MANYLENYGAGEAKREGIVKWTVISVLIVLVLSVTLFYSFRHFPERQALDKFVDALKSKDY